MRKQSAAMNAEFLDVFSFEANGCREDVGNSTDLTVATTSTEMKFREHEVPAGHHSPGWVDLVLGEQSVAEREGGMWQVVGRDDFFEIGEQSDVVVRISPAVVVSVGEEIDRYALLSVGTICDVLGQKSEVQVRVR